MTKWLSSLHTFDSLQFVNYRLYWIGSLLNGSGQISQQVVVGWLTYEVSHSPLLTAIVIGLSGVPNFLAAPLGGILADRWNRGKIVAVSDILRGTFTAFFAIIVMTGNAEAWNILIYVLVQGIINSTAIPSGMALIPLIIPRQHLTNAFSLALLTWSIARLLVPTVCGIMIALWGPEYIFLAGMALYFLAAKVEYAIKINRTHRRHISALQELVEAAKFLGEGSVLLPLILLSAGSYLFIIPAVHGLMPVFAVEVFEVGPVGLGIMMSALGMGATLGTIILASLGTIRYKGRFMLSCLGLMVLASAAFSVSPSLMFALPFIMLVSGGWESFATLRISAIQIIAPDHLRGKISAINFIATGIYPLGGIILGGAAEAIGAPLATIIASFLMGACIAGLSQRYRKLREY